MLGAKLLQFLEPPKSFANYFRDSWLFLVLGWLYTDCQACGLPVHIQVEHIVSATQTLAPIWATVLFEEPPSEKWCPLDRTNTRCVAHK